MSPTEMSFSLHDASFGFSVPLDDAFLIDVSRPWTAYRRWITYPNMTSAPPPPPDGSYGDTLFGRDKMHRPRKKVRGRIFQGRINIAAILNDFNAKTRTWEGAEHLLTNFAESTVNYPLQFTESFCQLPVFFIELTPLFRDGTLVPSFMYTVQRPNLNTSCREKTRSILGVWVDS